MFHKLPRSGSVSLSVNEGGQTGWRSNSPSPIWFSRICFRVELMCTKKGPQEWSPANVRGALIPGARLPFTSHWGLSVQVGPRRWRPGPPHHYHGSTGGLLPPFLWLRISQTPLCQIQELSDVTGDGVPGPPHMKMSEQQRATGTPPLTNCCLCDVRDEHNLKFRNIKKQKIQVKPFLSNCFPAGL